MSAGLSLADQAWISDLGRWNAERKQEEATLVYSAGPERTVATRELRALRPAGLALPQRRRRSRVTPAAPVVTVVVEPRVWREALALAGGDNSRLLVMSPREVWVTDDRYPRDAQVARYWTERLARSLASGVESEERPYDGRSAR